MTSELEPAARWDWLWGLAFLFDTLSCATFARDMPVDQMFRAFDIDPTTARTLSLDEALADPVLSTADFFDGPQWLRVAQVDDWTIALEHNHAKSYLNNIDTRIQQTAEMVMIAYIEMESPVITYSARDTLLYRDAIGLPWSPADGDLSAEITAELDTLGANPDTGTMTMFEQTMTVLALLSTRLGFSLSQEVCLGPLPTAHRMHDYHYSPACTPRELYTPPQDDHQTRTSQGGSE